MLKKVLCLFTIINFLSLFCAEFVFAENSEFASDSSGLLGGPVLLAKTDKKAKKEKTSKKGKNDSNSSSGDEEITGTVTKIKVEGERVASGFFAGVDPAALALVENGSPESLLAAYEKLKKASVDYMDSERVLIDCAARLMSMVWSYEKGKIERLEVSSRNAYSGALDSAQNGIYDTSTGNSDFLATVLPSVVLCNSTGRTEYYEQAEKDLQTALVLNPDSVLANYLIGLLYSKTARPEAAVASLRKAAASSSAFEISFLLASCLNVLGRYDESQTVTDGLVVLYPSNIELLKLLARNAFSRADYQGAERYALLVLQQNPGDLEMLLFRAGIFVQTGEYLKAASLLDVYSKSNQNSKDYLLLRARVQKEWNKNTSQASATIEKALGLYPNDMDVLLAAAELAGQGGLTVGGKSGTELANEVLAKNPDNATALSFLIRMLSEEGKWSEALASSRKLMASPNPSPDTIAAHSRICLALGLSDEAWSNASSLYGRYPNEDKVIQLYVEAMVRTGRGSQASRFINAAISSASSSMKSFYYYERSFLAADETTQLADLRSAVIANPRNSDALFRMYGIYFERRDYRKAQYYLRQVIAQNPNNQNYLRLNSDLDKLLRQQ